MRALTRLLRALAGNERGATAIEYTLLAALIGAAAIFGFDAVGESLGNVFERIDNSFQGGPLPAP